MTDAAAPHLARRAAIASSTLAFVLLGLKGWGAAASGSVAMLGSLADTALDLVASLVTLWGVHVAGLRADDDHRFGHGKAESLAALFQVVLVLGSAVAIAVRAAFALIEGGAAIEAETGILVSLVAGAATTLLLVYQRRVIARTRSVAIEADHLHYRSDLALNLAVAAALAAEMWLRLSGIDAAFAVVIAIWLAWGSITTGRRALDDLMDREWPLAKREAFLAVARTIPSLADMHDLRTRTAGTRDFAQFHISFAHGTTIEAVHVVMEDIEARLACAFPDCEVLIHPDPQGHVDQEGTLPAEIAERREVRR